MAVVAAPVRWLTCGLCGHRNRHSQAHTR